MTSKNTVLDLMSNTIPISIVLITLFCLTLAQNVLIDPKCMANTTKPIPEPQKYTFKEDNSTITCLMAQFSAYIMANGKYYNLMNGKEDKSSSNCGKTLPAKLVVDFDCSGSIQFAISTSTTNPTYIASIDGQYSDGNLTHTFSNNSVANIFHTTQSGHYYKCDTEQPIVMKLNNSTNETVTLVLSNFALEAFRTVSGNDIYQVPEECVLDSSSASDLVRIGVGVCLVALVAIVLIAYFIGRRRWSERSSYESV